MNPYAQIPAKILACLALLLSPGIRADTLFTLRLGFDSHPWHDSYHESFWPGDYQYAHWPFFYSPEFYGSYRPYFYIYYPSYYHSFYYYRPLIPFYYTYFYPWYFYPHHGYHHHDRYYSPGPHRHHNHNKQNHVYWKDTGAMAGQQYSSVPVPNRQVPVANYGKEPVTNILTGGVVMHNGFRGIDSNAPAGKNIKIRNITRTGSAPRVASSPAPESGRVINSAGNKKYQTFAVTKAGDRKNISPAKPPAPRRGQVDPHRSPSVTQSYNGPDTGHRQPAIRRTELDEQHTGQRQFRVRAQNSPGEMTPGVRQQQTSPRQSDRHDDQGQATGHGSSMRAHSRSKTR